MIRFILLFAWLQLRELINQFRWRRRTDAAERISRLVGVAVPVVLGILLIGFMVFMGSLAWRAGAEIGAASALGAKLMPILKGVVLISLAAMVILVPIGATQSGSLTGSARFVLLPIPRRRLHLIEVLAGIGNPMILVLLSAVVSLAIGAASEGGASAGAAALGAGILLTFVALAFGALLGCVTQWIFRDRGRGELILLIVMLLPLCLLGISPLLEGFGHELEARKAAARQEATTAAGDAALEGTTPAPVAGVPEKRERDGGTGEPGSGSPRERARAELLSEPFRAWKLLVPSEAYAMAVAGGAGGGAARAAAGLAALTVQGGLLLALSSRLHGFLLSAGPGGGRRRKVRGGDRSLPAFPGLSSGAAAIGAVQARTALRTVRGKIAVFCGGAIIVVQAAAARGVPDAELTLLGFLSEGSTLATVAGILALLFLQPVMYNQFASDGNGLAMQYLAPVSDRDLVRGKAAGVGLLLAIAMAPCLAASAVLAPGGSVFLWAAAPLEVLSVYVLTVPLGAFLSMFFPKTADLSKVSYAGNAHGLAGVLGVVGTFLAAAPPVGIHMLIGGFMGRPALALLLVAAWSLVAGLVAWPLLEWTSSLAAERRENLLLVARGR